MYFLNAFLSEFELKYYTKYCSATSKQVGYQIFRGTLQKLWPSNPSVRELPRDRRISTGMKFGRAFACKHITDSRGASAIPKRDFCVWGFNSSISWKEMNTN